MGFERVINLFRRIRPFYSTVKTLGVLPEDDHVNKYVGFGASPRGGQSIMLGAKVAALLAGRANVSYEDVDRVAVPALNHRLVLNFAAEAEGIDPASIIARIVQSARKLRR